MCCVTTLIVYHCNSELEEELKLCQEEVFKLQLTIKEKEKHIQINKMKNLCKTSRTEVTINPASRVDSSVQVSFPMNKPTMKDAQVSTQRFSTSTFGTAPLAQTSHRRTYSDGEVLVQRTVAQNVHFFPIDASSGDVEPQLHVDDASHSSSKRSLGALHGHTVEKERMSHKSSNQSREHNCSCHPCVWQQKAKSLQQRLKTLSEQVIFTSDLYMYQG